MKGISILEIIVSISILVLLGIFAIASFSNYNENSRLAHARAQVISEINYARSKTLASEERTSWGIHFESSRTVRFKGSSYSPSDPSNVSINLPNGTNISSIDLGGNSDIIFERLTGRANLSGSVTVVLTNNSQASTTINIYASGIAE